MYKLDLKTVIKNLKGEAIKDGDKDLTIGAILPDIVLAYKQEGSMRKLGLAEKIATKDSITVESADFAIIKSAVQNASDLYRSEAMTTLVKGRIEEYLESLKEEKSKES